MVFGFKQRHVMAKRSLTRMKWRRPSCSHLTLHAILPRSHLPIEYEGSAQDWPRLQLCPCAHPPNFPYLGRQLHSLPLIPPAADRTHAKR